MVDKISKTDVRLIELTSNMSVLGNTNTSKNHLFIHRVHDIQSPTISTQIGSKAAAIDNQARYISFIKPRAFSLTNLNSRLKISAGSFIMYFRPSRSIPLLAYQESLLHMT